MEPGPRKRSGHGSRPGGPAKRRSGHGSRPGGPAKRTLGRGSRPAGCERKSGHGDSGQNQGFSEIPGIIFFISLHFGLIDSGGALAKGWVQKWILFGRPESFKTLWIHWVVSHLASHKGIRFGTFLPPPPPFQKLINFHPGLQNTKGIN